MFTPPTVGKMLAIKPDRVIAWIRAGRLRAINVGDGAKRPRFRIDPSDLQDFLESRRVQPPVKRGRRPRVVATYPQIYPEV
jgi:hypothetical protein